jgi:hypothetical protein
MLEIVLRIGFRDPIVAGALDAFFQEDIPAAEISKAPAIAGVSKSFSNQPSQSKQELLRAFLKDRHAHWFEQEIEARYHATQGSLEIVANVLQMGFEDSKCLVLPFSIALRGQRVHRKRAEGTFEKVP